MVPRRSQATGLIGLLAVVAAVFLVCQGDRQEPPSELAHPPTASTAAPGAGGGSSDAPSDGAGAGESSGAKPVPVIRVVDGDTFHVLRGGRDVTIRLIGIDTPEVGWYGAQAECYGATAGVFVRRLLDGQRVALRFDVDRIDPYGRTLAYAYLEDGRMLNLLLVRRGFAEVTIYEPNDRYEPELRSAENAARDAGRGVWSACA